MAAKRLVAAVVEAEEEAAGMEREERMALERSAAEKDAEGDVDPVLDPSCR